MKIAVLSDIHGHLSALEATAEHLTRWRPDHVIINGDIVNRGPKSADCWAFVKQKRQHEGWLVTRGNHEDYVVQYLQNRENPQTLDDFNPISYWTFNQMGVDAVAELAELPLEQSIFHPQGGEVRAIHATRLGSRYGIWHYAPDEEVRKQIAPPPAVFCTGHIHFPFIRVLDQTLIVNCGSAGAVCDFGDLRATYAQISWHSNQWHAEIVRVPYDIAQAKQDYIDTNMLAETNPAMHLIYLEWLTGWPILNVWRELPQREEMVAELGLEAAVAQFTRTLTIDEIDETVKQTARDFYRLNRPEERPLSGSSSPPPHKK